MVKKTLKNGWGLFSAVSTIASAITTPWLLIMSIVAGWLVWFSSAVFNFVKQPEVVYGFGTMLGLLWTIIGVSVLRNQKVIRTVRLAHDYAHSLICDGGLQANLAKFDSSHRTHAGADALAITCILRNVGSGPAKLRVDDIRIIVDGRSNDDSPAVEHLFAKLAQKGIRSGGILRDARKDRLHGTVSYRFLYGPPDGDFVRKLTIKANIEIIIEGDKVFMDNTITEDKDEAYESR